MAFASCTHALDCRPWLRGSQPHCRASGLALSRPRLHASRPVRLRANIVLRVALDADSASPPVSAEPAAEAQETSLCPVSEETADSATLLPLKYSELLSPEPLHAPGSGASSLTVLVAAAASATLIALALLFRTEITGAYHATNADPHFWVSFGLAAGAFVQTLTGFGFAIVAVAALSQLDWIAHSSVFDAVQPIVATLSCAIGWFLVLPEIKLVEWRKVIPAIISSTLFTPVGVAALTYMDAHLVLEVLGALITSYVVFTLLNVRVPKAVGGQAGQWVMGAFAGFFGGAFDISGPPLVIYGQAAGWEESFRRNLMFVLSTNGAFIVAYDFMTGRLADFYYSNLLVNALPSVAISMLIGRFIAARLDASKAKTMVLATCLFMGLRLMLS